MIVPPSLRRWFVVHFVADLLTGVPLLLVPQIVLASIGWSPIDPVAARLVGAALIGIGTESFLGRGAGAATYRAMLDLKLLWSSSASLGLVLSIREGAPAAAWVFLGIFVTFFFLWAHYRWRLRTTSPAADAA